MRISVIGPGRWGSFIAWYLDKTGHSVLLYGRESSARIQEFKESRSNGLVTLPASLTLSTSLSEAAVADTIVISISAQRLRDLLTQLQDYPMDAKTIVLCMKGIESSSGMRLSELCHEYLPNTYTAVWLGPGHVQEFTIGIPNCMVIDSLNENVKHRLVNEFSSELIRFYYGQDLLGNEIGAAAKNVIGIAAGILDGIGLSTLKGALISRGAREIGRLIAKMGGSEISAYGLCHLGDYGATVFSEYSHNRMYGEAFAKGEPYEKLAEGVETTIALMKLSEKYGEELPICSAVYSALYDNIPPAEAIGALFSRSLKKEF